MEPYLNGKTFTARKCHICKGKLVEGEQFIWFYGCRGYVNICGRCMIDIGKLGESIKDYNKTFLALPEKERKRKFKMLVKFDQGENNI